MPCVNIKVQQKYSIVILLPVHFQIIALLDFVSDGSMASKTDEPRQNGTSGAASDDERHDLSALSVGDITIDSVKDHLL
jgi:hypothetical protein